MSVQVDLVEFRATGLEKIADGLAKVGKMQDLATASTAKYQAMMDKVSKSYQTMERAIGGTQFRNRVRETDQLVRSQERLTRLMERQATLARMTTWRGVGSAAAGAGGMLAGVGGAAAAGAVGMGLAGMSNTVPMARFQNQMQRLQWELGNLLTPYVNFATKQAAKAANWLSRQDQGTQDALGGIALGGMGLAAANFVSNRMFGMGIGTMGARGLGMARSALAYGGPVRAGIGAMGVGAVESIAAHGVMGAGIRGVGAVAGRAAPAAVAYAAAQPFISKYNIESSMAAEARYGRGDLSGLGGIADKYRQQFSGLTGSARTKAINAEMAKQLQMESEGIGVMQGTKRKTVASMIDMALGNMGDTSKLSEAQANQAVLRAMREGKALPSNPHRANAFLGGDWGELGSGYYTAASAYAKSGMDKKEGENFGETQTVESLLSQILAKLPDGNQPPPPGGQADPLKGNHLGPGFGS